MASSLPLAPRTSPQPTARPSLDAAPHLGWAWGSRGGRSPDLLRTERGSIAKIAQFSLEILARLLSAIWPGPDLPHGEYEHDDVY
jgi:hypothetical protein